MKNRLSMGLLVAALMVASVPGVASAAQATVKPKDACKNGGWMDLVDENGVPFTSEKDCKGFVKGGGIPTPPETIFAIAYSNLDGTPGFGSGDVLISKWVDENQSGAPDAGDRIVMGSYPTTLTPSGPADFGTFGITSHLVGGPNTLIWDGGPDGRQLVADIGGPKIAFTAITDRDEWWEAAGHVETRLTDGFASNSGWNQILVTLGTASQPSDARNVSSVVDDGDAEFIDVDIFI